MRAGEGVKFSAQAPTGEIPMPLASQVQFDPEAERHYRRGYIHGANEIISALGPMLTEQQRATLGAWSVNTLLPWSRQVREFERPPSPPKLW